MAIDFPAPPTPLQGEPARLEADAHEGAVSFEVAGSTMHVHAPGVLNEEQILLATAGAPDLSTAVRAIALAAQRQNVLAPKTLYAKVDNEVYVSVVAASVTEVRAPEHLQPYFAQAANSGYVGVESFEKARVLASVHASRAGLDLTPVFEPQGDDAYAMNLAPSANVISPGSVRLNLSNVGNRFTGREFLDLEARRGDVYGDEFQVLARTASTILKVDDQEPGSDYHESQLGWSRVTPYGLFATNGQYVDYRQQALGTTFNGELWKLDANWTGILSATPTGRLTVQGKIDYIHKQLKLDGTAQTVQKEPYPSVEAAAAYTNTFQLFSKGFLGVAGLSARKGFGNSNPTLTIADLGYWLVRPSYTLRSQTAPWIGELQLSYQYADVTVPEQQQWILGGVGNLNAYVPGVGLGDRGGLARFVVEHTPYEYRGVRFKPKAFLEYGMAEYSKPVTGRPEGQQAIADLGGEVVVEVYRNFEAAIASAVPIYDDNVPESVRDLTRTNFFFRLTAKF